VYYSDIGLMSLLWRMYFCRVAKSRHGTATDRKLPREHVYCCANEVRYIYMY